MIIKRRGRAQLYPGLVMLATVIVPMVFFYLWGNIDCEVNLDALLNPGAQASLLGVDDLGRDVVSCVVTGTSISLGIGLATVFLSFVVGGVLGLIAGLSGGVVDIIIMRLVDIMLAFPGILLALMLVAVFPHGILSIIGALVMSGWPAYARLARGEVLKYRNMDFILAAKTYNASFWRILFCHLLPLAIPVLTVQASLGIADAIIAESSLNFLGLGLKPEIPTLGQMLDAGRAHLFDRPILVLVPGIVLYLLIVSFNFIGEGLQEYFSRKT